MKAPTESRRRKGKADLVVMQPLNKEPIKQSDLDSIIGKQNALRDLTERLSQEANDIFERLQNGAIVKPGIHDVDFEVRCAGGRYTEVLRIDGHELLSELPRGSS